MTLNTQTLQLGIGPRRYALAFSGSPLIRRIQLIVSRAYKIHENFLMGTRSNHARHVVPRQVAAYLCRRMGDYSYPELGAAFQQHHTTVYHSVRQVEQRIAANPEFAAAIQSLMTLSGREDDIPTLTAYKGHMPAWASAIAANQMRIEAKLDQLLGRSEAA